MTFQTFSDRADLKRVDPQTGRVIDPNALWKHGTFEQHADELERLNTAGAGVYVMTNAGDGAGRNTASVQQVRAVFIDTDGADRPTDPPLEPHIVTESSPGKWHIYWLVADLPLEHFRPIQEALAKHYGSDESVKDLPRVMRIPGFYHRKLEPVMTRLLEVSDHPPYTRAEILEAWPFLEPAIDAHLNPPEPARAVTGYEPSGDMAERILKAAEGHVGRVRSTDKGRHGTLKWAALACLENRLPLHEALDVGREVAARLPSRHGMPVPSSEADAVTRWTYDNATPGDPWPTSSDASESASSSSQASQEATTPRHDTPPRTTPEPRPSERDALHRMHSEGYAIILPQGAPFPDDLAPVLWADSSGRIEPFGDLAHFEGHVYLHEELARLAKSLDGLTPRTRILSQGTLEQIRTAEDLQGVIEAAETAAGRALTEGDYFEGLGAALDRSADLWTDPYQTGVGSLDNALGGGLGQGLHLLAAPPGFGKSALTIRAAYRNAQAGRPVALFEYELSRLEVWGRILCAEAGLPITAWLRGRYTDTRTGRAYNPMDWIREHRPDVLEDAQRAAPYLSIIEAEAIQGAWDVLKVRRHLEELAELHGRTPLAVIDYVQITPPPKEHESRQPRERVESVTYALAVMARELRAPIWGISAMSRGDGFNVGGQTRLGRMSSLRETSGLEYSASSVTALYGVPEEKRGELGLPIRDGTRWLAVDLVKNRYGVDLRVVVQFTGSSMTIEEPDTGPIHWPEDPPGTKSRR